MKVKSMPVRCVTGGKRVPLALMKKLMTRNKNPKSSNNNNNIEVHKPATRYRPGGKALREIREYQKNTKFLIPHTAFKRLVREQLGELPGFYGGYLFQVSAMKALQEASEAFVSDLFSLSQLAALHCKRIEVSAKDMRLAVRMRMMGCGANRVDCSVAPARSLGDGAGP